MNKHLSIISYSSNIYLSAINSILRILIYGSFVVFFFACDQQKVSEANTNTVMRSFSDVYKPPAFAKDDRKEKIEEIVPVLQETIEKHVEEMHIPGAAYGIVVDNELVLAAATGVMGVDDRRAATTQSCFRIASMTKSFTAMAILKLRDEGKLSLSDHVDNHIPELAGLEYLTSDAPVIDIENLLTMTAGFPEDNPWGDRQLDEPDQMLMDLFDGGISFANVSSYQFEYSNSGYALLGNIISRASGMPYQEYIWKNILVPLGMINTYWEYDSVPAGQLVIGYRWEDEEWKLEPMLHDGSYGAMGGLITTIEDFSKYVSFHLSAWPPRSDPDSGPVKRSSLREMHQPQFPMLNAKSKDSNGDPCPTISGYGYGLGIREDCKGLKRVGHGGALPGFGSNYFFFPEYGVGFMAFCNLTYTAAAPYSEIAKLIIKEADLRPRKLPVSDILLERQKQVAQLIQHWDPELEAKILAENFYLDKSREHRIAEMKKILDTAGEIKHMDDLTPNNQLRGYFNLQAEHGAIDIFFTLTPEKDPKVQQLNVLFKPNKSP